MGEGLPERLAEGAASGTPEACISARAIGCEGIRMPTVSSPPDVMSGMRGFFGSTIVSGPGQKAFAQLRASAGISEATSEISARLLMCTMSGLSAGRSFARNIFATASSL